MLIDDEHWHNSEFCALARRSIGKCNSRCTFRLAVAMAFQMTSKICALHSKPVQGSRPSYNAANPVWPGWQKCKAGIKTRTTEYQLGGNWALLFALKILNLMKHCFVFQGKRQIFQGLLVKEVDIRKSRATNSVFFCLCAVGVSIQ